MTKKYDTHTPQTRSRHREEEAQNINSHKTSGRQLKQSNQPSLPQQYDYKGDDHINPWLVEEET